MLILTFSINKKILKKAGQEQAEGILIAPIFTIYDWFTKLMRMLVQESVLLPSTKNSLYFRYTRTC